MRVWAKCSIFLKCIKSTEGDLKIQPGNIFTITLPSPFPSQLFYIPNLPSLVLPARLSLWPLSLSHSLSFTPSFTFFSALESVPHTFCPHLVVSWFFSLLLHHPSLPPSLSPKQISLVFLIFFTVSPPPLCHIFCLSFTKQAAGSLLSILSNSSDSRRLFLFCLNKLYNVPASLV